MKYEMNKMDWFFVVDAIILAICMIAVIALIGFMVYIGIHGCPQCGCHQWIQGDEHVVVIRGVVNVLHDHICAECGYIF